MCVSAIAFKNRYWIDSLIHSVFAILDIIGDLTQSPSAWRFVAPIPRDTIFYACTTAINVLLTGLIVGKTIVHTRSISKGLGNKNVRWYNAIVSTMIESSALFSVCAIASAASWGNDESQSNANLVILAVTGQMTVSWWIHLFIILKTAINLR